MNRIEDVRRQFKENGIDSLLIESVANRRYVSQFTGSAGVVLITGDRAYFITDFRYVEQAKQQCRGFEIIQHEGSVVEQVAKLVSENRLQALGFEQAYMSYLKHSQYKHKCKSELVPITGIVENLRLFKNNDELDILKKAAEIADAAYEHIITYIKAGISEKEIANELEFFMRKKGAESSSFDTIVASGERGAYPHGVASDKIVERGELITMDFGAYYKGYCSDITRTVALGDPGDHMRQVYETVYESQVQAVSGIKAGMTGAEADAIARDYIYSQGYKGHFGHGLGHGLGMEVHEGPRLAPKSDVVLATGMVVTVEPGVYISGEGGVRIEDDIVITGNGNERLTVSDKSLVIIDG